MSVTRSIPQMPSHSNVELVSTPEDPHELWVIPSPELGCVDLPSLRHLLPTDFVDAPVVDFEPSASSWGAWVLRRQERLAS